MSNDSGKAPGQLVAHQAAMPVEALWAKVAAQIRSPFSGFIFRVQARANMRALQVATQHAKVVGELMDVATETIGKMQTAQDAARGYSRSLVTTAGRGDADFGK